MKMTPLRLVRKWCQFLNTRNMPDLISLYGRNSVLMPTFSNKIITNKKEMIDYYNSISDKQVSIQSSMERKNPRPTSNIIHGEYDFVSRSSSHKARYTFVFGIENSDWKIICHHSSLIPGESSFNVDVYKYLQRCNRYSELKI